MPLALVLTLTVMELLLMVLLISFGLQLLGARSFAAALDEYEKNPNKRTFTKRFIFGWQFSLQRKMARASIKALGNTFVTLFYRVAGAFFLIVAVGAAVAIVFHWSVFLRQ